MLDAAVILLNDAMYRHFVKQNSQMDTTVQLGTDRHRRT